MIFSGFRAKFQKIVTCAAFSIKFAKTNQKFAENSEFCENYSLFFKIIHFTPYSQVELDGSTIWKPVHVLAWSPQTELFTIMWMAGAKAGDTRAVRRLQITVYMYLLLWQHLGNLFTAFPVDFVGCWQN